MATYRTALGWRRIQFRVQNEREFPKRVRFEEWSKSRLQSYVMAFGGRYLERAEPKIVCGCAREDVWRIQNVVARNLPHTKSCANACRFRNKQFDIGHLFIYVQLSPPQLLNSLLGSSPFSFLEWIIPPSGRHSEVRCAVIFLDISNFQQFRVLWAVKFKGGIT